MKSKRFLTILLSLAIMLTFMPTMAFAAEATSAGHDYGTTLEAVDATFPGLKVLVEPTCTEQGVGEIYCTLDMNGEKCGAVKTVKINSLGHKGGKQVKMTVAEIMDYFKLSDAAKEAYVSAHPTWCEKYVYVCDQCGALVYNPGGSNWYAYSSINDILDIGSNPWVKHVEPTGLPACAETYTCAECGATDVPRTPTAPHDWATTTENKHQRTGHTSYVELETKTCTKCGKVETSTTIHGNPNSITHGSTIDVVEPSLTPCVSPGNTIHHVCSVCGVEISHDTEIVPHTYQTTLPYDKGDGYMYVKDQCVVCGADKAGSEHKVGYAPAAGDTVTYDAASAANCEQGSFILQTTTTASGVVTRTVFSDTDVKASSLFEKVGDKWYVKATKAELPFAEATKHDFEAMSNVAAPTCTQAGFDARVCKRCGKIDHASIKTTEKALGHAVEEVVVPATCGEYGYSYKLCTRCNNYLSQDGKTVLGKDAAALEAAKYSTTQPVVKLGEKCQYEWKTLEEATPFALGTRAKVCKVCNNELAATKESIAKKTIAAPKVKAGKKKATVTVKAVEGAVKYQIKVNGKVKKTVTSAKKVTIKKLKGGKKAKFQIVAFNAEGVKAASKVKSVKIKK